MAACAALEGPCLCLRMAGAPRIVDRAASLDAAGYALALPQCLLAPDFDEEGEVRRTERHLAGSVGDGATPLLAAAAGTHAWLSGSGRWAVAPACRSAPR